MSIGGYTLDSNPSGISGIIKPDLHNTVKLTYESYAYFSWGKTIIGKTISLTWKFLTLAEFNTLNTKYEADASIVLDPQDGSGKTYNIRILSFDSAYHVQFSGADTYRKDAKMVLLIESEV